LLYETPGSGNARDGHALPNQAQRLIEEGRKPVKEATISTAWRPPPTPSREHPLNARGQEPLLLPLPKSARSYTGVSVDRHRPPRSVAKTKELSGNCRRSSRRTRTSSPRSEWALGLPFWRVFGCREPTRRDAP
jgi:hypothetical protein